MPAIDKLLKFLTSDDKNVAKFIDEEDRLGIVEKVLLGYRIDDDSRSDWLEINKKAMEIVTSKELISETTKDFPIPNAAKVIYPLIHNSIIQSASMMIMHLVRNDRVGECTVLGKDTQIPADPEAMAKGMNQGNNQQAPAAPQGQQPAQNHQAPPQMIWKKASKAQRVSDFLNYEHLIESESWLEDEHRLMHIVSAWGVGFKEVYYDEATKTNCSELLAPEDVIINNNHYGPLEKARRISVRQYLTKNNIIEKIRAGYFLDVDVDDLVSNDMENVERQNDTEEPNPVIEGIRQFCYLDLDGDGYEEPYNVYVVKDKKVLLGIFPAFEFEDININPKTGEIISIKADINIVDRHYISSAEGKYWSYGLNHLLIHQSKSITAILRQLIDAGTIMNSAGSTGFVSKALKTRERSLRVSMGQFIPVDLPQGVAIDSQIMTMPIREPSQVLLALLQLLIDTAKETGFLTDTLTGQTETQNVPATTSLAQIEQATRAFKPVVQKMYRSLKKEFKIWFKLYSKYLDMGKYIKFQNEEFEITKDDFDDSLDICPVADPTMSSEAHKYSRLQAMASLMQNVPNSTNIQEAALRYYTDLGFPNPQALVGSPPQPPPDPKMAEVQLKAQQVPHQQQMEMAKVAIAAEKVKDSTQKNALKAQEVSIKASKSLLDAHKFAADAINDKKHTSIEAYNAETERQRVAVLDREQRKPDSPTGSA